MKHVQFNIQGEYPGAETSRELCICRTKITYVKEASGIDQKVIDGHKNPSDSHNYHDENHDEIEFYLGNSDRSTWWQSTLEQRTPKNQSDWLYGYRVLLTNVQCHRYLYPYHDIENTKTNNWKHTWNHKYVIMPLFCKKSMKLIHAYCIRNVLQQCYCQEFTLLKLFRGAFGDMWPNIAWNKTVKLYHQFINSYFIYFGYRYGMSIIKLLTDICAGPQGIDQVIHILRFKLTCSALNFTSRILDTHARNNYSSWIFEYTRWYFAPHIQWFSKFY